MAKKFFYVCAGLLCLTVAFHLGAVSGRAQTGGTIDGAALALVQYSDTGVDPVSWTPDHLGRRSPRCRRSPHRRRRIRLSSAGA